MFKRFIVFCSIFFSPSLHIFSAQRGNIRDFDFNAYFDRQYREDCRSKPRVHIEHLAFHDFDGDGQEEAMVVGSSCLTGTAGPDIHAVYRLSASGRLVELKIDDNHGVFEGRPIYRGLAGNRNSNFDYEDSLLVERFTDSSGRENPLTLYYRLSGSRFALVKVVRAPTYKTSFDCNKASSDAEFVICGNENLARTDLELNFIYKELLSSLPAHEKQILKQEQLEWIRARDKLCTYKWIVECLEGKYSERNKILRSRKSVKKLN